MGQLARLEQYRRSRSPKREDSRSRSASPIPPLISGDEWLRNEAAARAAGQSSGTPPPMPRVENVDGDGGRFDLYEGRRGLGHDDDDERTRWEGYDHWDKNSWEDDKWKYYYGAASPVRTGRGLRMAPPRDYDTRARHFMQKRMRAREDEWRAENKFKDNRRWGRGRRHCWSPPASPRHHRWGRWDDHFVAGRGYGGSSDFDFGSFGAFGSAGPSLPPPKLEALPSFDDAADWHGIDGAASLLLRFRANGNPVSSLPYTLDVVWATGEAQERSVTVDVSASGGGECSEKFVPLILAAARRATNAQSFKVRYENDLEWAWAYTKVARVAEIVSKVKGREAKLASVDGERFEYLVELGGDAKKEEEGNEKKVKGAASFVEGADWSRVDDGRKKQALEYIG